MSFLVEIQDGQHFIESPLISSIEIEKSISNLCDFAKIEVPLFNYNKLLYADDSQPLNDAEIKLHKLYKRGQKIKIYLGYNDKVTLEFVGYIKEVHTDNGVMILECEDELFIFRNVKLKNSTHKNVSIKSILQLVLNQVNIKIKLVCDYEMEFEKFTIHDATALDVLKQLQEDTNADVYFKSYHSDKIGKELDGNDIIENINTIMPITTVITPNMIIDNSKTELHFKLPYIEKKNIESNCDFSMQHNVEFTQLEYKDNTDRKVKVIVKNLNINGLTSTVEFGNTGGEEFEFKVNRISNAEMKKRAKREFDRLMQDGYTGTITTWLIPYVEPNYSVGVYDADFPEKDGVYNVDSVNTSFSEAGGVRTITLGLKLGVETIDLTQITTPDAEQK